MTDDNRPAIQRLGAALQRLNEKLAEIGGCSDSSCMVVPPRQGQIVTNGGCRCYRDHIKMQRVLGAWARFNREIAEEARQ